MHVPMIVKAGHVLMGSVGSVRGASTRIKQPPAKYVRDCERGDHEVDTEASPRGDTRSTKPRTRAASQRGVSTS